mmetsp:Transcript_40691/g.77711  ORF Transcript_40691/g.77711 Transcript_40691/m.77711 type:complete len:268 (-) Transcript_40691:108-911(-)|eukprot:CAMPEP_0114257002 /NCGR_PEP_ID=MMETSP0058-20121206/18480_1 /TAXON_ID=36894 /ORGANISM="Pyramimonas parkeae, CCMP726" /LENGTH=267 /DNA_ID=CAMNT_0001371659 /DNA_START=110 /DNA_END=913 /DNA_ORIENTATION=-
MRLRVPSYKGGTSEPLRADAQRTFPKIDNRRTLTRERAKLVYDRVGLKANDSESSYGGPATELLIESSSLQEANDCVLEFGHGSGALAQRLFARDILQSQVKYIGVDQSNTMAKIAGQKLKSYTGRVELRISNGSPVESTRDLADGSVDRFISTYVLDLLSEEDVYAVIMEARRVLKPDGLLCLTGITYGNNFSSWLMTSIWQLIYWYNIEIVGGCRPQNLRPYVEAVGFCVQTQEVVQGDRKSALGFMNNEVLVARPTHMETHKLQ